MIKRNRLVFLSKTVHEILSGELSEERIESIRTNGQKLD